MMSMFFLQKLPIDMHYNRAENYRHYNRAENYRALEDRAVQDITMLT